jgi:hypothetical protein
MPIQKTYEGKKLMYKFAVYQLSGTVQGENTRSETQVSGKIYGGGTNSTYGTTAPVQGEIKSETIRYQTIFLKEDDGTEHAVELEDLVVPCREGHKLALWRLGEALWFQGKNETTNQTYAYNKLNRLLYPKVAYFAFGIVFGIYAVDPNHTGGKYLLALIFATLIGLAIATIPCGIIAGKRKSAVLDATNTPAVALTK